MKQVSRIEKRNWTGRWIRGQKNGSPEPSFSPCFRKVFSVGHVKKAVVALCGLGWHELYINGKKADDRVLAPIPTQYHEYASYILYDVSSLIHEGENVISIWLGCSFYFSDSNDCWGFSRAAWLDYPKLICDVICDGEIAVCSDESWKFHDSPIVYNGIRTGEIYDARLELPGFAETGYDDSCWENASFCNPPGGDLIRETATPCRTGKPFDPVKRWTLENGEVVYDFGTNLTGWCRISVSGESGESVKMCFSERITESGDLERKNIMACTRDERLQTDTYILKGIGTETWEPRFTYHGFRYVKVTGLQPEKITAVFVSSDFENAGSFRSSSEMLNTLQECTRHTYLCNFTGFPTDCPHREKNGWTGDAQIAAETGLWNFDAAESYNAFLRTVKATQRRNGQFPGFAPNPGGSCYHWGNGPVWDIILFEIPYRIWLFTGDNTSIIEHYDAMSRYLEYCRMWQERDHLVNFGLGDWCCPAESKMAPVDLTVSAVYYGILYRMCKFAELLGKTEDLAAYQERAAATKEAYIRHYYKTNGVWGDSSLTALALPLYYDLVPETEKEKTLQMLVRTVWEKRHHADFGIVGAKTVPRVLAANGFAEDAYRLITQEEYPGWGHWIKLGATTLQEDWNGNNSQNHIMFGDISAWMYEFPGGIAPLEATPGFQRFKLAPCTIPSLDYVSAQHNTPYGKIVSEWKRENGKITFSFTVPEGTEAEFAYGETQEIIKSGVTEKVFPDQKQCASAAQKGSLYE